MMGLLKLTKYLYIYFRDGVLGVYNISNEWTCHEAGDIDDVRYIQLQKKGKTVVIPIWGIREYHFVDKGSE